MKKWLTASSRNIACSILDGDRNKQVDCSHSQHSSSGVEEDADQQVPTESLKTPR